MRVLVTGGAGQLGSAVAAAAVTRGDEVCAPSRARLDVTDADALDQALRSFRPDVVVNTAGLTEVDRCEEFPDLAFTVNAGALSAVATAANRVGAHVVQVSTDYVFDGSSRVPYREGDATGPINAYGRSKLAGERELEPVSESWTVVRTSWLFGARGADFVSWVLDRARTGRLDAVVADTRSVPTYAPDLADVLLGCGEARTPGTVHVVNGSGCTRHDLCMAALEEVGLDGTAVAPIAAAELNRAARRPEYSVLDTTRARDLGLPVLRDWREALHEYLEGEA